MSFAYNFHYVNYVSIAVLIFGLFTTPVFAEAVSRIDKKTSGLLQLIGSIEAPSGYNAYSYYASAPPPKPLTRMTVREVLAWQDKIDRTSKSEAAGRFQIMEDTLRGLVRSGAAHPSEYFNSDTQLRLAITLMKRRGWNPNSNNYVAMANSLAQEWAALPLVSGPNKGKSYYRNTKGARNRAQISPETFLDVMTNGSSKSVIVKAVKLAKASRRTITVANRPVRLKTITRTVAAKKKRISGGAISPSKVLIFQSDPFALD